MRYGRLKIYLYSYPVFGELLFGRERLRLFLDHSKHKRNGRGFSYVPPMGVGVEAIISDCHFPIIRRLGYQRLLLSLVSQD